MLASVDPLGLRARTVADAGGGARFERLPRGRYQVRAVVTGMPSAVVDIGERPTARAEIRLE